MTNETDPTILALNPGAEQLGFAVTQGLELRYYGARPFDGDDPNMLRGELAVFAAEEAMDHFRPDRLAVANVRPDGSGQAMRLNVISDRIRAVAKRKGLPVDRVARAAARKAVTGDAEASREALIETLADAFPQLQTFLPDGGSEPDRDAADVFEAVGLALAAGKANEWGKPVDEATSSYQGLCSSCVLRLSLKRGGSLYFIIRVLDSR